MYSVDLHAHTRFFHGRRSLGDRFDPLGVRLLAEMAERRGLDGVATTNHDYYTAFDPSPDVETLPGIEITTDRGHVLVVGPDPPAATKPGALSPRRRSRWPTTGTAPRSSPTRSGTVRCGNSRRSPSTRSK